MNFARRFLAMLLCLLLAASPAVSAFAEQVAAVVEIDAALPAEISDPAPQPEEAPAQQSAEPEEEAPVEISAGDYAEAGADEPEAGSVQEPAEEPEQEPEAVIEALPELEISQDAEIGSADAPAQDPAPQPEKEPDVPAAEPTEAPAADPTEAPGATFLPENSLAPTEEPAESTAEPTTEPTEEPAAEPSLEPTMEPEAGNSGMTAAELPEFTQGYVRLTGEAMGYDGASPDAQAVLFLESGVLYASGRRAASSCDRLQVYFDGGEGEISAWADAKYLLPLNEEETAAFIQARSGAENVRCFSGDSALPLDVPVYGQAMTFSLFSAAAASTPAMLLDAENISLGVKEKRAIQVSFSDGADYAVSYASENSKIASVSAEGVVTGKTRGTTTIRLTSELGNEASVTVTVKKAPEKIKLYAPKKVLGVQEDITLTHKLNSGSASAITYTSSNSKVAKVEPNGQVFAIGAGTATITAKTYNKRTSSVKLTVKPAPTSVELTCASKTMGVGEKARLTVKFNDGAAGGYTIRAYDDWAFKVTSNPDEVEALVPGGGKLYVETHNGCFAECTIPVYNAPAGISFPQDSFTVGLGEKILLPEITLDAKEGEMAGGGVTYKTSNSKAVAVNQAGYVKGKRTGKSTITVSTYNGHKDTITVYVKKAPGKVTLNATAATLGVGEKFQLKPKLPAGTHSAITFISKNPDIASVSESGEIIALKEGTAKITANAFNGKYRTCTVTVKAAPAKITAEPAAIALGAGQTAVLNASVNPGSAGALRFRSEDTGIVSVNASGELTAHKAGQTSIIVSTYTDAWCSVPVEVKAAPSCVKFSEESMVIGVGEKVLMPKVILGAEGEDCAGSVSYKSANSKYAVINQAGYIKGKRAGKVKITVTTHNGKKGTLNVTVRKAPSKVTLNTTAATMGVGEELQLTAKLPSGTYSAITFESKNPDIATVSESGKIIAVAPGTAKITASAFNGKYRTCTVTVKKAPTGLKLSRESITLGAGETAGISTVLPEGCAGACRFESSDPSVVTIGADGALKAVAPGSATIHAETYNGHPAQCTVTVKKAPSAVTLQEGSSLVLSIGDSYTLLKPAVGEGEACSTYTYKSSNTKYVKVSSKGLIKGVRAGSATITVTSYNKVKDSVKVTFKAAPKSISFAESAATLFIGDTMTPVVKFSNSSTSSYSLTTSDKGVVSVSGRSIKAVSAGSATITAESFNGRIATMKITVPALPDSIEIKPASRTLGAGDSYSLTAVMPEGQGSALNWFSSDEAVAAVSASGKVSAKQPGSCTITVETTNGLAADCALTVKEAPTRLQLSPRTAGRMIDEGSMQLKLSFGSANEGGRVSYASSDETIATVSSSGKVSFKGVGSVRITAKSYNGMSAVCDLTIGEQPTEMTFPKAEYDIALGDTINIPVAFDKGCESYSYRVSDESIAAAAGDTIRALSAGSATLTAESISGLTAECTINVVTAPTGITLEPKTAELTLSMNGSLQLSAQALPSGIGSVYFTSSNSKIAEVDYVTGMVTAKAPGNCTITAFTYDGSHAAQCSLHVRDLLEGVKIGIDPGHQLHADRRMEAIAPGSRKTRHRVASGTRGVATGIREHVVNLQIGLKLRDALESFGAEVYMTRETADVNISNQQRAKMMNELGVDLVLRIHCNAGSSSKRGMSIYVRQTGACKAESVAAAKLILKYMSGETGAKNLGVKYSNNYTGLNWSTVPSMLMELGYMSNAKDDRLLCSSAYQDKLVRGMVNGICDYMGRDLAY